MEKVIRDGMVAVLYSPGYGAGWSTWGAPVNAVFDPDLVKWVEEGRPSGHTCLDKYKNESVGTTFHRE